MNLRTTRGSALGIIVRRAEQIARGGNIGFDRKRAMQKLLAYHKQYGLRVTDMAKGRREDIAHDVFGILRNFNPVTGEVADNWTPRHSKQPPMQSIVRELKKEELP